MWQACSTFVSPSPAAMVLAGVPCGTESSCVRVHLDIGPGAIRATLKGCLLTRDRQHKGVALADVHIPYAWWNQLLTPGPPPSDAQRVKTIKIIP